MCVAGCWQIRALLHGAKSAATPAFFLPLAVVLLETHLRSMSGRLVGQVEMRQKYPCHFSRSRAACDLIPLQHQVPDKVPEGYRADSW